MSGIRKDATISACGLYRYRLTRIWGKHDWSLMPFVMLNPSIADAEVDDPTIRRCMGFAKLHGYDGIDIANLYAFRATKPADLWKAGDPFGPYNDAALIALSSRAVVNCVPIVCAWGAHGGKSNRPIGIMQQAGATLHCLGRTKGGQPRHPLYVRADQPFEAYP